MFPTTAVIILLYIMTCTYLEIGLFRHDNSADGEATSVTYTGGTGGLYSEGTGKDENKGHG